LFRAHQYAIFYSQHRNFELVAGGHAASAIIGLDIMDFDQLTTFIEIAKLGSFSRAGQKLFRSQPAVSAQVRQLEQEYGKTLRPRRKSVRLTSAGETLFEYAVRMVNMRGESLRAVADKATTPRRGACPRSQRSHLFVRAPGPIRRIPSALPSRADQYLSQFQSQVCKGRRWHRHVGIVTLSGQVVEPENPFDLPGPR